MIKTIFSFLGSLNNQSFMCVGNSRGDDGQQSDCFGAGGQKTGQEGNFAPIFPSVKHCSLETEKILFQMLVLARSA